MQIDCYGFEASSQWFRRKELEVYLMKEVEGILYICYGNKWDERSDCLSHCFVMEIWRSNHADDRRSKIALPVCRQRNRKARGDGLDKSGQTFIINTAKPRFGSWGVVLSHKDHKGHKE